ncbi:hypothetical protein PHJA_002549800 [Phtheirospermum japonicum]|uniref:Uncharacterized protein n=1 Tax=Phtheirospermum japonicum TaxID=374723 RepID=A0A830D2F7_9LAMI|nr:hypothetical protein PHJA_002549800 [Phtheirospermum japonicum]
MELHPTPYPVRSQYMNPKSTRKLAEAPKTNKKIGPPLLSEKRVFGTARNPNIPLKRSTAKPSKAKPSSGPLEKSAKPSQPTRSPPVAKTKSSSGKKKNPERPKKKKSVCFQENEAGERNGNAVEPRTPAKSPAGRAKHRLSITPYRSAERCSKCRFDKLETSSYWLCQIKLAETVGKHSVSAVFFRLAFDCEAEPIRNIRIELKKYVARHEYLNGEEEWKKLLSSYGLVKEENNVNGREVMASVEIENESNDNQEDKDLLREIAEVIQNLNVS